MSVTAFLLGALVLLVGVGVGLYLAKRD